MKITLTIDELILAKLEERAHHQDMPLEQVVNQVLRRGLEAEAPTAPRKQFHTRTFSMGQPLIPSLDTSLAIAASLEDAEIARALALRK